MYIIAGHIGTGEIAKNPDFNDIFFDGESHYYIDGTVQISGKIPVIMVDTDTNKYYNVKESRVVLVSPYDR